MNEKQKLAEEIEDATQPGCVRDLILSVKEREMIIATLRAEAQEPVAWMCNDERYPWIKGLVTTSDGTVEAWRSSDIAFVGLGPISSTPQDPADPTGEAFLKLGMQGIEEHLKTLEPARLSAESEQRWYAVDEVGNDNFATSIYETGDKGLLVARCNQNGQYPWQAPSIIRGLAANKTVRTEPQTASTGAFDFASSALAAQRICDCMEYNFMKRDAPYGAAELYGTAKKLRDLLAPHKRETPAQSQAESAK